MASELEKLISTIQKNIHNGELKTNIISNFQNLCGQIQNLSGQIQNLNVQIQTLTHEKICVENNCLKQINAAHLRNTILSDKVMALQNQLLQQKTCFEKPQSDSIDKPAAHMDTSYPSPNIITEPKLINESVTGVVKFFNIEKKYGIINFTENENGTETLKDAFIYANNISKSKIEKPVERNLQPNETVVFDLYQIKNDEYVAKNVTGPNGENVKGVYVVYQKQITRMPNQRQHQPNYRNQPHPRSRSRPRSYSIRRNQLNDYQHGGRNIFR
uniref:CSD domain-containing protein n=1 Tax=Panagrolaimus davidi TaxID=227884 RepID=A0A914PBH4_9BILA